MSGIVVTMRCPACHGTKEVHVFGWDIKRVIHNCPVGPLGGTLPKWDIIFDPPRRSF